MMDWLLALVVWTATGARIGRVAARRATPLRVAMVVAVSSAGLASTFAITDVAARIDGVGSPRQLSETLIELAWTSFAAASAVGAVSVWPILPRRALRPFATIVYSTAILLGIALVAGYSVPALFFVVAALTSVVVTGAWHIAWTPLGRGIALVVAGSAIALVAAVIGLIRESSGGSWFVGSSIAYSLAAVVVSLGTVWVLAETWVRARRDLRRIAALHTVLATRFPEVVDSDVTGTTTVLRASDSVAHIMDALYLQAGAGTFDTVVPELPKSTRERAEIVSRWIGDPVQSDVLGTEWIAPPEGMSPRRWVLILAAAHTLLRKTGTGSPDPHAAHEESVV